MASALLLAADLSLAAAQEPAAAERPVGLEAQRALTLTIYNEDLALVSETREASFTAGENRIALLEVAERLRPETVILEGEGLQLVEQSFDADVLTLPRMLEAALGQPVWVRRGDPEEAGERYLEAELVSIAGLPVVRIEGRLESVAPERLAFASDGLALRARPTLTATLLSAEAGQRLLTLSYLTGGLSWQADYVAYLDEAENRLDLTGLVTLRNDSGTAFEDARLRLVAGEVQQVRPAPMMARAQMMDAPAMAEAAAPKVVEQPVGEQHLYTLDRPITLGRRETKQVALLSADGLPVAREYRFEDLVNARGGEEIGPTKAAVVLEFANQAEAGLGKPLPRGVLRVYQASPGEGEGASAAPVFIGEDAIQHTAEGETVRVTIGRAFDVTGEARRTVFERISNGTYETGQEITVRNAKEREVTVKLVGNMPRGWRMLEESQPHEAETANRVVWTLAVPAGGSATLSYRARISSP